MEKTRAGPEKGERPIYKDGWSGLNVWDASVPSGLALPQTRGGIGPDVREEGDPPAQLGVSPENGPRVFSPRSVASSIFSGP